MSQTSKPVVSSASTGSDPFALLMGTVDLNLKDTPLTRDNVPKNDNSYKVNTTPNVGFASFQNKGQSFPVNQQYYGAPNMAMPGNSMVPMNTYVTGTPIQNTGMYQPSNGPYIANMSNNVHQQNPNMYGHYVTNIPPQPQQNVWNNGSNFNTVNMETDNPFR